MKTISVISQKLMAEESHDCSEIAKVPTPSAGTSSSSDLNLTMAEESQPRSLAVTSTGCIININMGHQGDVGMGVGGDFIKGVQGNFNKYTYSNIIKHTDGNNIKVLTFVVLKSKYRGKFLRLTENDGSLPEGFLKFEGGKVATAQAKFELVPGKSGNGLVHLRCCSNNKYLVRYDGIPGTACPSSDWIVAAADKPEENKNNMLCTLFKYEPVNTSEGLEYRFRHIQLDKHACLWTCSKPDHSRNFGGLHGGSRAPDKDEFNVYTVVAWESLAIEMNKVPTFVALKLMNSSNYLSLTENDTHLPAGFLKFNREEVVSPLEKFELEMEKNEIGLVHIRCCNNNKYLVIEDTPKDSSCNNNKYWIVAAADKPEKDDDKISCTLFKLEPYNESGGLEFRFRHINLGMYIYMRRRTDGDSFHEGLYVGSDTPNKDAFDVFTMVDLQGSGQQ